MSTITLPVSDPRGARAVAIATDAGQWLRCRTRDGRKAYGIPSSRRDGRYYLTTRTNCDCYDAQRHACKHMLAVRLHCELVAEQQAPKLATEPVEDLFKRFEDDPMTPLRRILGKPRKGVIPAALIERED
jgi:hypothetical protein